MSYLDSRDLIERLGELEGMESAYQESIGTSMPEAPLDDDETTELSELRELADAGIEDWQYGATLIPESDFEEYARQLADDIGAIPDDVSWPMTCIDWEQAARELQVDYTDVTYQGKTYYVRG